MASLSTQKSCDPGGKMCTFELLVATRGQFDLRHSCFAGILIHETSSLSDSRKCWQTQTNFQMGKEKEKGRK